MEDGFEKREDEDFLTGAGDGDGKSRAPFVYWLAMVAVGVVIACAVSLLPGALAHAVGELTVMDQGAFFSDIDVLAKDYEDALEKAEGVDREVAAANAHADELEQALEEQRQRSVKASRRLFALQSEGYTLLEMLLGSGSLKDFMKMSDYLEIITRRNLNEISATSEMRAQLKAEQEDLDARQEEAHKHLGRAKAALRDAQDSRANRQQMGIAECFAEDPSAYGAADGADWYASESEFVAEWAPRIDAYLEGSPMAGLGQAFAEASWRYCVDPRWSPAISNIESGKGRACARPYNAWGWGAADEDPVGLASEWGSWESAIDAHVRGLSDGYGYTISLSGAKAYCTRWKEWYADTLSQMAEI